MACNAMLVRKPFGQECDSIVVLFTALGGSRTFPIRPESSIPPDIVFIATTMTAYAIGDVGEAFFPMLTQNVPESVLMATIARISAVVLGPVAGGAFRIVIAIKAEVPRMVEGGWRPGIRLMAARAIVLGTPVEGIGGWLVTSGALALLC